MWALYWANQYIWGTIWKLPGLNFIVIENENFKNFQTKRIFPCFFFSFCIKNSFKNLNSYIPYQFDIKFVNSNFSLHLCQTSSILFIYLNSQRKVEVKFLGFPSSWGCAANCWNIFNTLIRWQDAKSLPFLS